MSIIRNLRLWCRTGASFTLIVYYSDGKITMADKAQVFKDIENGGDMNV